MSKLMRAGVILCLFVSVVPVTFARQGQKRELNFKYRMPKIAKGIDLSEVPVGAEYKEGEIMVFFEAGANGKVPERSKRQEILQRRGKDAKKKGFVDLFAVVG